MRPAAASTSTVRCKSSGRSSWCRHGAHRDGELRDRRALERSERRGWRSEVAVVRSPASAGVADPDEKPTEPTDNEIILGADGQPRDAAKKPLPPLVTFIGAGVTGALLIGSIISTVDVYARADDYEAAADQANAACQANPGSTDCTTQYNKANQLLDDGEPTEMRTTILWVATGVVGAATAIIALTLTDWSGGDDDTRAGVARDAQASTLHMQPLIDPVQGSAGLRLGAQF